MRISDWSSDVCSSDLVLDHAQAKLARKGCDWIVANDVSGDVMGGRDNTVHIITQSGVESWDRLPKDAVARKLVEKIADALRSEEHTSELQSLMRISYAVFCLKKKTKRKKTYNQSKIQSY